MELAAAARSRSACGGWRWSRSPSSARDVLVAMAQIGVIDLSGPLGSGEGPALEALRRLESAQRGGSTRDTGAGALAPDVADLERRGARELLAGEVELDRRRASAVHARRLPRVRGLGATAGAARAGGGHAANSEPRWSSCERRGAGNPRRCSRPRPRPSRSGRCITTYGAVPYDDVDPTPFVGDHLLPDVRDDVRGRRRRDADRARPRFALSRSRQPRLAALRKVWPMIAAAGAAAVLFGVPLRRDVRSDASCCRRCGSRRSTRPPDCCAVAIVAGVGLLVPSAT